MKKIRFKFIFISAITLFIVLFCIIFGLNIANSVNSYHKNADTIQFIHNLTNSTSQPFPDAPPSNDPEEKFRNRFFIANFADGKLLSVDITNVARIDAAEASKLATAAYETGKTEGTIDVYQYGATVNGSISKYVFLDIQKEKEAINGVILVSSLIALGGYSIVLLLIVFFSSLIIRPYELANAKQKRFITDASHELKTPLTVLNSNLEIIEMENGESDWTKSSKKQIENLSSMTNQLVLLSRLNEYDSKVVISDVNIKQIIDNSSMSYVPLLNSKNINLVIKSEEEIIVKTDSSILSQIFNILLDNMLKYALPGDAFIIVEKTRSGITISFKNKYDINNNIDIDSLFDRFYRGDASRNASTKGFGIGLSLAKSLSELIKCKLSVSTSEDIICFKIVL